MILVSKKNTSSIKEHKKYLCFGIDILLDCNTIYVLIRRDNDLTPILEKLDDFFIYDECDIKEWSIIQYLNGKRISLMPECLKNFDWDLYHDGNLEKEREFESIYSKMKSSLLDKLV